MTRPGDWTQVSQAIGKHSNHYAIVTQIPAIQILRIMIQENLMILIL